MVWCAVVVIVVQTGAKKKKRKMRTEDVQTTHDAALPRHTVDTIVVNPRYTRYIN
jgi:hypothetical protein